MSDLISRQNAIDLWDKLSKRGRTEFDQVLMTLPSTVCDDCIWHVCNCNKIDWDGEDGYISKRDALAEFRDGRDVYDIMESIEELPSAEPKTGRWVRKEKEINDCDGYRAYYWHECDNCGARPPKDQCGQEWNSDFCPNCGARMKGGDEE